MQHSTLILNELNHYIWENADILYRHLVLKIQLIENNSLWLIQLFTIFSGFDDKTIYYIKLLSKNMELI